MDSLQARSIALERIVVERCRQDELKAQGRFKYTLADEPGLTDAQKLLCIMEEVGEVGRAILGDDNLVSDGGDIEGEVVQIAALSLAWLERLVMNSA